MALSYLSYVTERRGTDSGALTSLPLSARDGDILEIVNTGSSSVTIASSNNLVLVDGGATLEPEHSVKVRWVGGKWREVTTRAGTDNVEESSVINFLSPGLLSNHTSMLQTALDDAGHIYLAAGTYFVDFELNMSSNTRLQLHPGATMKRMATFPQGYQMLRMENVSNIIVEGGCFDGNKSQGFNGFGQAAGICPTGASDVVIRDLEVKNWPSTDAELEGLSYGYGIYLGSYGRKRCSNILISNVVSHDNDQDNFHVASCCNVTFLNCRSYGAALCGIDIEPGVAFERIKNLKIINCLVEGNELGISFNNHESGEWEDILIDGCTVQNNVQSSVAATQAGKSSGLRIKNCMFRNNGGPGLELLQSVNAIVEGCQSIGNTQEGFEFYECQNLVMQNCNAISNGSHGISLGSATDRDFKITIVGNGVFNNAANGINLAMDLEGQATPVLVGVANNRVGNSSECAYPAWAPLTEYFDDFRVINDDKVYQLIPNADPIATNVSGNSGGPTGTGLSISDGTCVWKYIMPEPEQQWGVATSGRGVRGVSTTRNIFLGNAQGDIYEDSAGDDNTIYTTDILETQHAGQKGSALTRSRAAVFEDKSGTPGDVTSHCGAGIAAVAAGGTTCTVTTAFSASGDIVKLTPLDIDANVTKFKAVAGAGSFTVTVNTAAAATWKFAWEVIKKGSFP